jgi:hypothetical protein
MAFTLEDGTGLANSNAYISVSEFDAYWDDRGFVHSGFTNSQKQVAIIKATDFIELKYRTKFKGKILEDVQALSFPRISLYDNAGRVIEGIPVRLKQATAEYAKRALTEELISDPTLDVSGNAIVSKTEKVGPIEESTTFSQGSPQLFKNYPAADRLLEEYITAAGGRTMRA